MTEAESDRRAPADDRNDATNRAVARFRNQALRNEELRHAALDCAYEDEALDYDPFAPPEYQEETYDD